MPIASRKMPSVAPVDIEGITGEPGKYLAASFSAGPMILGSSAGGWATGRIGRSGVIVTLGSPIGAVSAAWVSAPVRPGNIRQLIVAAALWGSALLAWPPSSKVATQVVRSIEWKLRSVSTIAAA